MERLLDGLVAVRGYMPGFLEACVLVLEVTVLVVLLSWLCGLIAALAKTSGIRPLRGLADFYVWFVRGTPTLIQIFIVYFGLPQLGIRLSPFTAGVVALGVNGGAYVAEIIRGGLLAIPKGQSEAAYAFGMTYLKTMRRIVLPQVIRVILPPITNEAVTTLKNTSLLSTITLVELTLQAQIAIATTFRPFDFYIAVALLYLAMTTSLMWLAALVERRYAAQA